jgi:Ni,Fe-hydrogenase III component G
MDELADQAKPSGLVDIAEAEDVTLDELLTRVKSAVEARQRFITATCIDCDETFQVLYHFADGLRIVSLRLTVPRDAEVPSISGVVFPAFLVENEIRELFGLNITGIAIDYGGRLLLTEDSPPRPMARFDRADRN